MSKIYLSVGGVAVAVAALLGGMYLESYILNAPFLLVSPPQTTQDTQYGTVTANTGDSITIDTYKQGSFTLKVGPQTRFVQNQLMIKSVQDAAVGTQVVIDAGAGQNRQVQIVSPALPPPTSNETF